jgi:3-deoxy-manno-octulosonate cytidylyltransferase (CMP-KDO synthetase)
LKEVTGIIPVRYASQRFPGKPLALILGKPMIQWVYERAQKSTHLNNLIIATDDKRIREACHEFGADVRMTSLHHVSGTDRVAEVAESISSTHIINIQGDEPLVRAEMIDAVISEMLQDETPMVTLAIKVEDLSLLEDQNIVKIVTDKQGFALYFSRSPLPFQASDYFFQHIGIYGYQRDFLLDMCQWPTSRLEKEETLEQLRVLESGYRIKVVFTHFSTLSVDTPKDIIMVENFLTKELDD